jgi:haloalkane dehalogenase
MVLELKSVEVNGSSIKYFDEGEGDPVVFVHGVPTSSRIWRGILPKLCEGYRCIAPDLIGLGQSDKPDIEYTINDYIEYFTQFIEALNLEKVTLVLHAWGSIIGLSYAMSHPGKIKGIACFESYLRPIADWTMMSLPMQELAAIVNQEEKKEVLSNTDFFIERLLPRALLKDLPEEDIAFYKESLSGAHRQPLLQYLRELPTGSEPEYVTNLMTDYSEKLKSSEIPKLLIYGVPGYNTTMSTIVWAKDHLSNLTLVDIGPMLHFPQVSNPDAVATAIREWLSKIS